MVELYRSQGLSYNTLISTTDLLGVFSQSSPLNRQGREAKIGVFALQLTNLG
jgi:hypothetical protein